MDLEEQIFRQKVLGRSLKQWILLYTLRIVLNFVVLALLGGSISLIYFATAQRVKCQEGEEHMKHNSKVSL